MPVLISLDEVLEDDWVRIADDAPFGTFNRIIVGEKRLRADWQQLENAQCKLGVELQVTDIVEEIKPYLDRLELIALNFPVFADGRAFSQSSLLRKRYGYTGDIRAVGDVLRDQLSFMQRCGFSQFLLADSEDVELALRAFSDISNSYQPEIGLSKAC